MTDYENLEGTLCPGLRMCGVDEVGRGPLIGSVVCAAVILPDGFFLPDLTDSKKLTAKKREKLDLVIREQALSWCIAEADAGEIDRLNIFQATMQTMVKAVNGLSVAAEFALIDGNKIPPGLPCKAEAIVKGDGRVQAISAASVLAKVYRDRQMEELDAQFPAYGFARHKGYPTKAHFEALRRYGPLPQHRRSFAPVRDALAIQPEQGELL